MFTNSSGGREVRVDHIQLVKSESLWLPKHMQKERMEFRHKEFQNALFMHTK